MEKVSECYVESLAKSASKRIIQKLLCIFAKKETIIAMDEIEKRMDDLYNKPVSELIRMVIELQDEVEKLRVYRKKLIKVRNLVVNDDERRRQGRPRKGEEII